MAAEFEKQSALLLSWDDSDLTSRAVILNIARHAYRTVPIVLLVKDQTEHENALLVLQNAGIPPLAVRLLRICTDTPWVRDYGPTIVQTQSRLPLLVDAVYNSSDRPNDDLSPQAVSQAFNCPHESTGLQIEGGNLLSNGDGLGIATSRMLELNRTAGYTTAEIYSRSADVYGFSNLVVLEPLHDEPTGHVDMFATFTAVNTVVISSLSPDVDLQNSQILDRNAALLKGLPTRDGPLKVVRLPMPRRQADDSVFPTWTNVVYANGTLLVPTYGELDPEGEERAIKTFQALLPKWRIQTIDCRDIIESCGALHCLTMNLPWLSNLPLSDSPDMPDPNRNDIPPLMGSFRIPLLPVLEHFDDNRRMFVEDVFLEPRIVRPIRQ